jgi:hypothetical protein
MDSFESGFYQIGCDSCKIDLPKTRCATIRRSSSAAGTPCMINALDDSTVEVVMELPDNPAILKVCSFEDILCSNVYTHSILNLVYQTYEGIQNKYGSILQLATEEIVAQLVQNGLAPQTACRCVDLIDHAAWQNQALPLRYWLERIRDIYVWPRLARKGFPQPTSRSAALAAREAPPLASV